MTCNVFITWTRSLHPGCSCLEIHVDDIMLYPTLSTLKWSTVLGDIFSQPLIVYMKRVVWEKLLNFTLWKLQTWEFHIAVVVTVGRICFKKRFHLSKCIAYPNFTWALATASIYIFMFCQYVWRTIWKSMRGIDRTEHITLPVVGTKYIMRKGRKIISNPSHSTKF